MTIYNSPLYLQLPTVGPATVDAGPVRDHLEVLSVHGIGYRRAAEKAGLNPGTVRRILFGTDGVLPTRVARTKAEQLLAVHPDTVVPRLVDARGTQRRIQALMVCGWSQAKLAGHSRMSVSHFKAIMTRHQIRPTTAHTIAALYERLWDVAPPLDTHRDRAAAHRVTRLALAAGYVPPLAWDDIDTDSTPPDPDDDRLELEPIAAFMVGELDEAALEQEIFNLHVDWVAVDRACDGISTPLNYYDRRAAIRRLNSRYLSDRDIATTLHLHDRVVHRIRHTELQLPARFNADQTQVIA